MCICRKWWAINGSLNPLLQLTGVTCMKCLSHQSSPCNLFPISFCKEGYKYLSKHSRGKKKNKTEVKRPKKSCKRVDVMKMWHTQADLPRTCQIALAQKENPKIWSSSRRKWPGGGGRRQGSWEPMRERKDECTGRKSPSATKNLFASVQRYDDTQ